MNICNVRYIMLINAPFIYIQKTACVSEFGSDDFKIRVLQITQVQVLREVKYKIDVESENLPFVLPCSITTLLQVRIRHYKYKSHVRAPNRKSGYFYSIYEFLVF